jgi:predicted Zn-dependent peptidase
MLGPLAEYLSVIGTDSLRKQQLEAAWQRMGVTMTVEAGVKTFVLSLSGRDAQLVPALQLLAHFLRSSKGDAAALHELRSTSRVTYKAFGEQKDDVLMPLIDYVRYGQQSDYLHQPSQRELKQLRDDDLQALFRELQTYDSELFYVGRLPLTDVTTAIRQHLPVSQCRQPRADTYIPLQPVTTPTVYFYHVPKSRQNYVCSYESIAPATTDRDRVTAGLWGQYMGRGMSSVLFQHVREFSSLAYTTQGILGRYSEVAHQSDPAVFMTMVSEVQNSYPSFRQAATVIANYRMEGHEADPNGVKVALLPSVTAADVTAYHRQHVSPNQRVWMVIGDRRTTDMKALARYGTVVELRKDDIYR